MLKMAISFLRNIYETKTFKIIGLIIGLYLICVLFNFALALSEPPIVWSGKIIDKNTGEPLENAVIIRSWDRIWSSPAGGGSGLATFKETLSDRHGKFSVSIFKRLFHIVIPTFPITSYVEEGNAIVFKPGYEYRIIEKKTSTIELERIPESYYSRYIEYQGAMYSDRVDFYKSKHLKNMVEREKEYIEGLDQHLPGVWCFAKYPEDIAIDRENNVYVAAVNTKGTKGERCIPTHCRMEIEIDQNGNAVCMNYDRSNVSPTLSYLSFVRPKKPPPQRSYQITRREAFEQQALLFRAGRVVPYRSGPQPRQGGSINSPPPKPRLKGFNVSISGLPAGPGEVRFALTQNKRVFLISVDDPFLFSYDLEGHLLCKQNVSTVNGSMPAGSFKLIDIDSTADDNVVIAYSYRDENSRDFRGIYTRNGVLLFDQNCSLFFRKEIEIDHPIRSIQAMGSKYVAADKDSIYVYDKDFKRLFKEKLKGTKLGAAKVREISRISSDMSGTYLYIIEDRCYRILKYNLKTREFFIR